MLLADHLERTVERVGGQIGVDGGILNCSAWSEQVAVLFHGGAHAGIVVRFRIAAPATYSGFRQQELHFGVVHEDHRRSRRNQSVIHVAELVHIHLISRVEAQVFFDGRGVVAIGQALLLGAVGHYTQNIEARVAIVLHPVDEEFAEVLVVVGQPYFADAIAVDALGAIGVGHLSGIILAGHYAAGDRLPNPGFSRSWIYLGQAHAQAKHQ